jgi:hypothetical protein
MAVRHLMTLDWRSQLDTDSMIYMILVATWVAWRGAFTTKGQGLGRLSTVMVGMFSSPYLLYATDRAGGGPGRMLLGVHAGTA